MCLLSAGCFSVNPYNVLEGEGAYLKNGEEYLGKARFIYKFVTGNRPEGRVVFMSGAYTDEIDTVFTIPDGKISLGVSIIYYPDWEFAKNYPIGERAKLAFDFSKESEVLKNKLNGYDIRIHNPTQKNSALWGIKLNAKRGITYKINCKVEYGRAYIWIEEENGKKVTGIREGNLPNEYGNWNSLPDPVIN